MTDKDQIYYKKGHDKFVSSTHSWRTVENAIAFMIPIIQSHHKVLDVGCGPGTITVDFARYVPKGFVTGIDSIEELLEECKEKKRVNEVTNVDFRVASVYELPFEDNTFDIVYEHQVLTHLQDPVKALKEMTRVTKPGAFVCCKDFDAGASIIYPKRYEEIVSHFILKRALLAQSNITMGRSLRDLALANGFSLSQITSSASVWCTSNDEDREITSQMYIQRILNSKEAILEDEEEDKADKREMVQLWKEWSTDDRGWLTILNGEMICRK
ncbi:uncharacterized protein PRCAT00005702001 [Priceomyces carsonii]|uniref:uncharacterized protein n=1 Tax=Priceomyces carsonii TaxID=28549 RepID=UPI002ED882C4|nr:unnamed protein product [Priceomyces carsonii]